MKLTPDVMDRIIEALHHETTIARAAKRAQISERTLYRIVKKPEFQQRYREVRRETVSQAMAHLQRYSVLAVHTLGSALRNDQMTPAARVAAARAVLRMANESALYENLNGRLDRLERRLTDHLHARSADTPPPAPAAPPLSMPSPPPLPELVAAPAAGEAPGAAGASHAAAQA